MSGESALGVGNSVQVDNSEYRRMLSRLPEDLRAILDSLGLDFVVRSYSPQYMGWAVEIEVNRHQFRLVGEGSFFTISELIDGTATPIAAPTGSPANAFDSDSVVKEIKNRCAGQGLP